MIEALAITLTSSYIAWFFKHNETQALYPFDSEYSAPADPRLAETRIDTGDGATLVVWRAEPAEGKPTVLYLPGNAGTLSDRSERFSDFLDSGYGLVVGAYRGSSGSTGRPDEATLTTDAARVADLAAADGDKVILYGESLGAALAIKLAASGVGDALALEAPFTNFPDLVDAQYPLENIGPDIRQRWDSHTAITLVEQPLLILHGREDRVVPQAMGRALYQAAASPDKIFLDVDARGHGDLWASDARAAVFAFIDAR
jgi:pimeloyl-ACP methyl ester carboxylesterase